MPRARCQRSQSGFKARVFMLNGLYLISPWSLPPPAACAGTAVWGWDTGGGTYLAKVVELGGWTGRTSREGMD